MLTLQALSSYPFVDDSFEVSGVPKSTAPRPDATALQGDPSLNPDATLVLGKPNAGG